MHLSGRVGLAAALLAATVGCSGEVAPAPLAAPEAAAALPVARPVAQPVAQPVAVAVAPLPGTGWPALDAAIARIPGYAATAPTSWQVSSRYGHDGSTLLPAELVVIDPAVPLRRLDAVVRHEWSHVLQSRAYGGDTAAMLAALEAEFGGGGVPGVERAADCMALQLGATWTHYTDCADPRRPALAGRLLALQRL